MAEEGGNLSSKPAQTLEGVGDASSSSSSLPILFIVIGEPLSEKHKDTVVKRIASGD